jgi:chromosome segregation ATPase
MTKIVRPADNVEPVERSSALGLEKVTTQEDIAQVAAQLAELTQTVEAMAKDLKAMTERADTQEARSDTQEARSDTQEARSDTQEARSDNWRAIADIQDDDALMQQERVDLAARELADVSRRLQAAATLLQDSGDSGSRISGKRSFAE